MPDAGRDRLATGTAALSRAAECVWLPTAVEMGELDREAVASGATTERTLIEAAGREVARRVQAHWPEGTIVAVAGHGHNGADALVALRTLRAWGREVTAVRASDRSPEPNVLIGWDIEILPPDALEGACAGAAVVLDGILGTGVTGPPRPPQASLIERVNALRVPVAAVDGPSGADFSSGAVPGACIRADLTVSLGWPNLGLLRFPAREYCGRIEAVEIGFPPPTKTPGARAITARWVAATLVPRGPDAHKGRAGYLTLVAGQSGMAGAAVLGARAALRGGVGILRVLGDPGNREILQRSCPGAIYASWDAPGARQTAVEWANALAVGPGLGRDPARRELVEEILEGRGDRPAVVDADGLSVFEGVTERLSERLGATDLITPHPGEAARLLGATVSEIRADPHGAALTLADELGCVVLLKGAPSVVAEVGQPVRVGTTGGPAVASGGSGDVLTGLIGAYLAAGMPAADAGAAALFLSGMAASGSPSPAGHLASDTPERLPDARAWIERLPAPRGPLIFVSEMGR